MWNLIECSCCIFGGNFIDASFSCHLSKFQLILTVDMTFQNALSMLKLERKLGICKYKAIYETKRDRVLSLLLKAKIFILQIVRVLFLIILKYNFL